jgi:hypothetical protein
MGANGQIGGKNRSSTFGGHVRQIQGLYGAENTATEHSKTQLKNSTFMLIMCNSELTLETRALLDAARLYVERANADRLVCGMFKEVVAWVLLFDDVCSGPWAETKALYCIVKLGQWQIAHGLGVSDI